MLRWLVQGVKELRAGAAAAASSCGVLVTTYETLRAKLVGVQ